MKGEWLFLGCGGSMGVPMVGCDCAVCLSRGQKNKRMRPAALLTWNGKSFLIDVGPDFREQSLCYSIDSIDALLITHTHYDHVGGLDDLRPLFFKREEPLKTLLSLESLSDIKTRYSYLIEGVKQKWGRDLFSFQTLFKTDQKTSFLGEPIEVLWYKQGDMVVNGYRFGSLAYVTDIQTYDEAIFDQLKEVEILILSALRWESAPTHFDIDKALAFGQRVNAKKTYLTHLSHEVDYASVSKELPSGFFLAFDGLKLFFGEEH